MSVYTIDNMKEDIARDTFDLERDDPSLSGQQASVLEHQYRVHATTLDQLFLSRYGLEYISQYFQQNTKEFRILTYPRKTNTCYEKAEILGTWNPLNIIKAFYLESSTDHALYAVVVPETGCFIDKSQLSEQLDLPEDHRWVRAEELPRNMSYGTCSPFIVKEDLLEQGGRVKGVIFDTETLILKKHDNTLDDFSFGLSHRVSAQMNYYHCFRMLKERLHRVVMDKEILTLSSKEKFVRRKGKIRIEYDFHTVNYRTAQFINSIHGYGDVSVVNDHVDELDLPDVLTMRCLAADGRTGIHTGRSDAALGDSLCQTPAS